MVVIAVMVVLLIGYDVWTAIKKGATTTISWTLWTYAQQYPIIPFALGVLMGHLFWVQHG
jgi:hypothetical protein